MCRLSFILHIRSGVLYSGIFLNHYLRLLTLFFSWDNFDPLYIYILSFSIYIFYRVGSNPNLKQKTKHQVFPFRYVHITWFIHFIMRLLVFIVKLQAMLFLSLLFNFLWLLLYLLQFIFHLYYSTKLYYWHFFTLMNI